MKHQVLARKWRPHTFSQVVGQEHVVKALQNSIHNERLHHAYLFTGTRGVGKTTIARILAKALNCQNLHGTDPCGECVSCIEIDQGCFVDLLEIDAASRTKVEDTRELLENVQYAPTRGVYKIYLIDEVHMLSGHSFNALLKTLEEPPPHVKFLLATTDPQKIPVTVLSRCLQFHLRRMQPEQIAQQMHTVLSAETIPFESAALELLAQAADGSMRDGLSLLDQAIVCGGGQVTEVAINDMLGTIGRRPVMALLQSVAKSNIDEAMAKIQEIGELVSDMIPVYDELLRLLHQVALCHALTDRRQNDQYVSIAADISPEDAQLFYDILLHAKRDVAYMPSQRSGLEMAILRMLVFRPKNKQLKPQQYDAVEERRVVIDRENSHANSLTKVTAEEGEAPTQLEGVLDSANTGQVEENLDWMQIIKQLGVGGMTRQLAQHCMLASLSERQCVLQLSQEGQQLRTPQVEKRLQEALQKRFGEGFSLKIEQLEQNEGSVNTPAANLQKAQEERQGQAEALIAQDENVRSLIDQFDASIIPGSTRPIDPD